MQRLDEQIDLLRTLWTQETVIFERKYHTIHNAGINHRPNRSIPIWTGGWADPMLRRTAEKADGWMPLGHPDDFREHVHRLRGYLTEQGRDPDMFPIMGAFGRDGRGRGQINYKEWLASIRMWKELGVNWIAVGTQGTDCEKLDDHLRKLYLYKEQYDR